MNTNAASKVRSTTNGRKVMHLSTETYDANAVVSSHTTLCGRTLRGSLHLALTDDFGGPVNCPKCIEKEAN